MDDVLYEHALGWERVVSDGEPLWDPGVLLSRKDQTGFLDRFASALCIYSRDEQRLFSRYRFHFPEESGQGDISIRPDNGFGVFVGIPEDAVADTGIRIFSGECVGGMGVYIKVPSRNGLAPSRTLPFVAGLRRVLALYQRESELFLPVIDLRDISHYENRLASINIYRIDGSKLLEYDNDLIKRLIATVQRRLHSLFLEY